MNSDMMVESPGSASPSLEAESISSGIMESLLEDTEFLQFPDHFCVTCKRYVLGILKEGEAFYRCNKCSNKVVPRSPVSSDVASGSSNSSDGISIEITDKNTPVKLRFLRSDSSVNSEKVTVNEHVIIHGMVYDISQFADKHP